jgi:DNA-binding response OmpR family regulator
VSEDPARINDASLMLTKRNTKVDRQHGSAAGANAYMTKRFDADDLQTTVRSPLSNSAL